MITSGAEAAGAIAYSPGGQYIAARGEDKTLIIRNASTGETIRTLYGHNDRVISIAYSPDGRYIASGAENENVKVWSVANGKQRLY